MSSAVLHFTQSMSLPGTNSYAWSVSNNWEGGALAPGDNIVVNQPAGATGVSYDDEPLSGGVLSILSLTVPNQSPLPELEIAAGRTLEVLGGITNSGTIVIDPTAALLSGPTGSWSANVVTDVGGILAMPNFLNTGTFAFTSPSADIYLTDAQPVWSDIATNTVENFGLGDELFLRNDSLFPSPDQTYTAMLSGTTLTVSIVANGGSAPVYELPNFDVAAGVTGVTARVVPTTNPSTGASANFLEISAVCFLAGTRIATERGEIAVEELRQGELVLAVGSGGRILRPIRWIGNRRLDLTTLKRPESLFPIRIRRGAFAENIPQRDLLVSPDHCLFVDGELIPAKLLVNGMTIVQDRAVRVVHYYHVELDSHDVLLADGLPTESYLDTGNRGFFAQTDGPLTLYPELEIDAERLRWQDRLCAPLRLRSAEIEPAWQRLAARAETLGYRRPSPVITADPDLRLIAQDREFRPVAVEGDRYVFVLPGGISDVRIASRSGMPVSVNRHADDWRRLGVAVGRIGVRVGDERIDIPVDHPALTEGWHRAERDAAGMRRWTDGDAALPLGLSARTGAATVEIQLAGTTAYVLEEERAACLAA
jgi:hypothetical protein